MKIGILTFHCAHNYGAVLQAYALQEYLKSCGHKVEVIDYCPWYITGGYKALSWPRLVGLPFVRKIKRIGYWLIMLPRRIFLFPLKFRRGRKFEAFITKKLILSQEHFEESGRVPAENYDAIVFGSDQIWSPNLTNGGDPMFLGNFASPTGMLKIAYAASAGAASEVLGENPIFTNALKNFDAISVRESDLADSLQPETELKIETVLDPTLLVEKSVWEKLAAPPNVQEKYVLVYQVSYNPDADRIAKELATQLGASVVSIWSGYTLRKNMLKAETPEQFVGWFKNATCVVTTSFHGTAFGLIFEKPLYYVGDGNLGECRAKQALDLFGLSNRYILGESQTPKFSDIDYDALRKSGLLKKMQHHSRQFLEVGLGL